MAQTLDLSKTKKQLDRKTDSMTDYYDKIVNKLNKERSDNIKTINGVEINKSDFYKSHFYSWQRLQYSGAFLRGVKEYQKWRSRQESSISLFLAKRSGKMMLHIEVFFMMLCSSYEMLAWELNYVFPTQKSDNEISFTCVVNYLTGKKRKVVHSFLKTLKDHNKTWIKYIRNYRDYIVHRGILPTKTHWGRNGLIPIMLPDNPKCSKLKYSKKRELAEYCKESLLKSIELFRDFYKFINSQLASP